MALLDRALASGVNYNGEIAAVRNWEIPHNVSMGVFKSSFAAANPHPKFVLKNRTNMGRRLLSLHLTCQRRFPPIPTPILVRNPVFGAEAAPHEVRVLGSACSPEIAVDLDTKRYHLLYWVNAWSESSNISLKVPLPLFNKGRETPTPSNVRKNFVIERDLPDDVRITESEESEYGVKPILGSIGAFNPDEFFIAPWNTCYLSRVDLEALRKEGPYPAEGLASIQEPNTPFFKRVKFLLRRVLKGEFINDWDKAVLQEAGLALRRLVNLNRCTRVLMYTTGEIHHLSWEPTETAYEGFNLNSVRDYLVVENPRPVTWYSQQTNKVLACRPKWTSYINGSDSFVTAPLNFRFPAAASTNVVRNCPQIDFTLSDVGDWKDGVKAGITLPQSRDIQRSPVAPAGDVITVPRIGISLIEIMSILG